MKLQSPLRVSLVSSVLALSLTQTASAAPALPVEDAPRHDICADLPSYFGMGVSSFSDYGPQFIGEMSDTGVNWNFVYLYVEPSGNRTEEDLITYVIRPKVEQAQSLGAMPVLTFYNLLNLGRDFASPAVQGDEPTVVEAVLKDPALMREYFEDFAYMLTKMNEIGGPFIMHVEPDSWGFMMWAFGIEGNPDATSVEVAVGSSGHPDLAGFDNHAGGFGRALLHLRDLYAPAARMGWHASNFRFNSSPEVVTSFYSSMGPWDLLVGEGGHIPGDNDWWEPLDEGIITEHMAWHQTVTQAAELPMLSWQRQIGYTDYQFMEVGSDYSRIERYAENGVIGFAFGLQTNTADANDAQGTEVGYTELPPGGSDAGGTALEMRPRLTAYYQAPVALPEGSICYSGTNNITDPGGEYVPGGGTSGGSTSGGTTSGGSTSGGSTNSGDGDGGDGTTGDESGCSCDLGRSSRSPRPDYWWLALPALLALRRRKTTSA